MTKYILAGGNDRAFDEYPRALLEQLPYPTKEVALLSCFFSSPESEWADKQIDWRSWFKEKMGIANHTVATHTNFVDEVKKCNTVYFHGGDTKMLIASMLKVDKLKEALSGKVVIGSSAGANMLSRCYWSSSLQEPRRGLGLVQSNVMVHYGARNAGVARSANDWKKEDRLFQEYVGLNRNILHLPEGEFEVFEVEE